jgi:hypothetical protein
MQSELRLSSDWVLYLIFLTNYLHLSRVRVVCLESGRSLRTVLGLLVVQSESARIGVGIWQSGILPKDD